MITETRDMPAGRELDALVCEALGITGSVDYHAQAPGREGSSWYSSDYRSEVVRIVREGSSWYSSDYRSEVVRIVDEHNQRFPDGWTAGSTVEEITHYPRVSEDMGAAWQVVEAMHERGYGVKVSGYAMERYYFVSIGGGDGQADTAPLAICRAALAAVGGGP